MTVSMEMEGAALAGPHPALARRPEGQRELAMLVGDWTGRIAGGGQVVEPKFDGIRALWIDGQLVTREGTPIAGAEHIEAMLLKMEHEAAVPLFVDGEWVVDGTFDATLAHFRAFGGNGDAGTLWIFEAMPLRVWRGEDPCETLEARRGKTDRLVKPFEGDEIRRMPWAWMTDVDEIERHARDFIAQGGEGIVVKHALSTYRRKRGTEWQRIKRALTLDLEIVDAVPQKDRPHMLGALVVDHKGKEVRISAGFSDTERMALWRDRRDLPGLIVEVEAMEVTEADSLRSPRFVRLRLDKEKRFA